MQLADVIASVRRHWRVSVAILLLSGAALGLFLFTRNEVRAADRWSTTVQVLVSTRESDGALPEGVPPALLQGQAAVALSGPTTTAALEGAGLDDSARSNVTFGFSTPNPDAIEEGARTDILRLTITAPDSDLATNLANSYATAYIDARRTIVTEGSESTQSSTRNSLEILEARLGNVEADLRAADPTLLALLDSTGPGSAGSGDDPSPVIDLPAGTPLETQLLVYERRTLINRITSTQQAFADASVRAIVPPSFATVVERSVPLQITPELPSPLIPVALAIAAGLLLAVAVPVLIDRLDHTIRDARAAGNALSATVLTTIPAPSPSGLVSLAKPGTKADAAYRALAATSVATDQLPRAIVVTSPVGTVQDNVAANFAAALAGLGLRVALLATDPRQGWFVDPVAAHDPTTLPDLLAVARAGGLNGQIHESLLPTRLENLSVLAPGKTGIDALLDGLPILLRGLVAEEIDVTVIAGPALLEDPSASILAWSTRSVLWVIEAGEVTEQEAREAASRLTLAGATPFGIAMVSAKG